MSKPREELKTLMDHGLVSQENILETFDFVVEMEMYINSGCDPNYLNTILWEYGFLGRDENYVEVVDEN